MSSEREIPDLKLSELDRVELNINKGDLDSCWDWLMSTYNGYPQIRIRGATYRVTRIVYKLHYGVDPGSLHVCHTCDRPICCNPYHLFLGTDKDNATDKEEKGRGRQSSLSDVDKLNILTLSESMTHEEIGNIYGMSGRGIGHILQRLKSRKFGNG